MREFERSKVLACFVTVYISHCLGDQENDTRREAVGVAFQEIAVQLERQGYEKGGEEVKGVLTKSDWSAVELCSNSLSHMAVLAW